MLWGNTCNTRQWWQWRKCTWFNLSAFMDEGTKSPEINEVARGHTGKFYHTQDTDPVFKERLKIWTQNQWRCVLQMKILWTHCKEAGTTGCGTSTSFHHVSFFFFHFVTTFWIILYMLKCGPTFPKTQFLDTVCPTMPIPHASILPSMSIFGVCWNKTVFLIEGLSWSPSWKVGTLEVTVLDLVSCPDTHQLWHRNLVA